jgi:aromatic-amino-acid transaminase
MSNARVGTSQHGLFATLKKKPPDPLLSLIAQFRDDPREQKIDLGVGVYRDANGVTPVMRCVKEAERLLLARQSTKSYLGSEGDVGFVNLLKPLVCGATLARDSRLVGVQTPGGTGALRLAAEVIAASGPHAKVWLGLPGWPNHEPIFSAAGLTIQAYRCFDVATQHLLFDEMISSLKSAQPGDVVLLHGCCHNPTGSDFDITQWIAFAKLMAVRGLVPLLDFAYQGFGRGFEPDAAGIAIVLEHVGEALIAYSCDKNFGLYRERTGALFALAQDAPAADRVYSNMLSAARANWAMPPDHGAAVVRLILESDVLSRDWRHELEDMRNRVVSVRQELAAADPLFAPLVLQRGMFSLLPLDSVVISRLQVEHGIYMAGSGRINVAGIQRGDVERLVRALHGVRARHPVS